MLSRRALLTGGALASGVGAATGLGIYDGVLPGRPQLQDLLGLNGDAGVVPDIEPGPVLSGSFESKLRLGEETGWSLMRPPGHPNAIGLPLVVALHARGWDHETVLEPSLGLPQFLAQAVQRGVPPFQILSVDGGASYWHRRPSGDDAGAMVFEEVFPRLRQLGDPSRIGLLGWSMGGYGALRLAADHGRRRVAAVVAVSPAVWRDASDANELGFADEEEYEQYSAMDEQDRLEGIPVRIDCGTGDPLYREVEALVDGFPDDADLTSTFEPGAHNTAYWRRMLPEQLEFLGTHL